MNIDGFMVLPFIQGPSVTAIAREQATVWPTPGFFPREMVPGTWSFDKFGYDLSVDFSQAQVTVMQGGNSVLSRVLFRYLYEITWTILGSDGKEVTIYNMPPLAADTAYDITISARKARPGLVNGAKVYDPVSFSYTVTLFEASHSAPAGVASAMSSQPKSLQAGRHDAFTLMGAPQASGYRIVDFGGPYAHYEDHAESLAGLWTDYLSPEFSRSGVYPFDGASSYVLRQGSDNREGELDLKVLVVPGPNAVLKFNWAMLSPYECGENFFLEGTMDGGRSWTTLAAVAALTDF